MGKVVFFLSSVEGGVVGARVEALSGKGKSSHRGFENHDDEAGLNPQETGRRWEEPNVVLK